MLDLSSVLSLPPPPRAAHFRARARPLAMCAAFASRVCAALPFALVLTLAAFSQLPGRSESTIALLQNAAYPDVADAAATFGPRIPRAGLTGTLFLAAPLEGCAPLAKHPGGPWIALMERSEPSADCGFITKGERTPRRAGVPTENLPSVVFSPECSAPRHPLVNVLGCFFSREHVEPREEPRLTVPPLPLPPLPRKPSPPP